MDRSRQSDEANLEDCQLLGRIAAGDSEAFNELFQRYHPYVVQFATRRLKDCGAAEEAAGEALFAIWRNAKHFRGDSRASTWIYGVAHYKCLAASRARRRKKRAKVIPIDVTTLTRVPDGRSLSDALEARDQIRQLDAAMDALPAGHRRVMEMAFFEDRPYAEIARHLGVREDTVKTRVARARTQLRRGVRALEDAAAV